MRSVDPDKVYRGPRPRYASDVHGIKTSLDLESGLYEFTQKALYSEDIMDEKAGIHLFHIRIGGFARPTRAQLESCLKVLTDKARWPVYVHCREGKDRTGIVCAYYRIKVMHWPVKKAIEEMYALGFHRLRYFYWVGAVTQ
jgi:protein tyrosine/serine phosphatase